MDEIMRSVSVRRTGEHLYKIRRPFLACGHPQTSRTFLSSTATIEMLSVYSFLVVAVVMTVAAAVAPPDHNTAGFSNAQLTQSAGKKASCVTGTVNVAVTANNSRILLSAPATNMAATELFVEFTQVDSSVASTAAGGPSIISGSYGIYSKLCFPSDPALARKVQTIQFLTHGGTLDNKYWDFAPGYSYVDAAAAAGYATFSYDRLGTGLSDHPDPVQIVQLPIQVEIAHVIVQKLRTAGLSRQSFKRIIGVGHSLGTGLTQGVMTKYPEDFDAAILTGTSTFFTYGIVGVASTDMQIANTDPSGRFDHLANGYFTPAPVPQSIQFAFYRYPHFDPQSEFLALVSCSCLSDSSAVFNEQVANKQTNTLGEMLTLGPAYTVASEFTGPIDVVNGLNDYFYCGGNCTYPQDQAALVQAAFFPAASKGSQSYLVLNSGHNINLHFTAPQAFNQMINFLQKNLIN